MLAALKVVVSLAPAGSSSRAIDVGAALGERAARVAAVARDRARRLHGQRAREHLALAPAARAQDVHVAPAHGCSARSWSACFFNNFLPSNIGGDVIRIRDTARAAQSQDAGDDGRARRSRPRPDGPGPRRGDRRDDRRAAASGRRCRSGRPGSGRVLRRRRRAAPAVLAPAGFGRLLQPLTVFHPEWVGRPDRQAHRRPGAVPRQPGALARCFGGAVFVQAMIVVFYFAVAYALNLNVALWDLAVIVPLSFVVQMLPVSVNGFGVREATFSFYFTRIGLPIESALLALSLAPRTGA